MSRAESKIMDRVRRLHLASASRKQIPVVIELIKIQNGMSRRVRDSEISHMSRCRIKFGVSGERTHFIQPAIEIELSQRFERHRIQRYRQRLFTESQQLVCVRVNT